MAIGDDATAAGYPLVPNTGEEGKVRYGAREINRTRDIAAQIQTEMDTRVPMRISSGSADPLVGDGNIGDIYFKVV